LERLRLFFAVVACGYAAAMLPTVLSAAGMPLAWRLAAAIAASGLAVYWALGLHRGGFALAGEPLEALAVFLVLRVAPGNPFLPLLGLMFRSFYGGVGLAVARYFIWMGALITAHASRGAVEFDGDLARAAGTAFVAPVLQLLRATLERLEGSKRRLGSLVQNSTDIVTVVGANLLVRWQADSIQTVLGHDPSSIVGSRILDLVHPDDRPMLERYFADARGLAGETRTLALRVRRRDGRYAHFEVVAANRLEDPDVSGFVLNMRDATERLRLERELRAFAHQREHDANHDPLTGLANRRKLSSVLDESVANARRAETGFALVTLDLDRFKELNDTLGRAAGDQLLLEFSPRLLDASSGAELLARVGGAEFAVVLAPGTGVADGENLARALRTALEQPFQIQGLTVRIAASVGIATYPEHGLDAQTLTQRADIAMYAAKSVHSRQVVYDASRDQHTRERLALICELPDAIAAGQLILHYQPKFDLQTGMIAGAEALVRWMHPTRGLLPPGIWLDLAEGAGLMGTITPKLIDDAIAQSARWSTQDIDIPVAVNLAAANVIDTGLPATVQSLLRRHQLPPSSLQLEITETMASTDPANVAETLCELRALGIRLSLDDFGTGSSSLSFLRQLPVQELKIDRSFIRDICSDDSANAIIGTIIELAHNLGMTTVGEGIETTAACEALAAHGCDQGQGFLLARPMPPEELTALATQQAGRSEQTPARVA
jgi:diguanylate cyclase (GGDEF)-like protein/PAS domain S-box-containing protein